MGGNSRSPKNAPKKFDEPGAQMAVPDQSSAKMVAALLRTG
jgi:hypothetical protein